MSAAVAQVLRAALGILETDGWTQGSYHNTNGRCAAGAIYAVTDYHGWAETFDFAAVCALEKAIGVPTLARWNDTPGRTLDEVLAAFKAAIVNEESS